MDGSEVDEGSDSRDSDEGEKNGSDSPIFGTEDDEARSEEGDKSA